MAAPLPPGAPPPIETLDESDLIDETAPPQRSPLRGAALPFAAGGPGARGPVFSPSPPSPPSAPPPAPRFGEETAPAERSPLAAALPFRHAKASAATTALPVMTPEMLAGLAQGRPPPPPAGQGPGLSAAERARVEQAKTVAFAMPPGFGEPAAAQQPASQTPHPASHGSVPPPAPGAHYGHPGQPTPPARPSQAPPARPSQAPPARPSQSPPMREPPPHASPVPAGGGPVAARSTGHFGLSIEQYAALCAEVAVFPERAEAIFAQYGLAVVKDRLTADAAWQERLRADHALMARWQGLYLYYHEHYHRMARR